MSSTNTGSAPSAMALAGAASVILAGGALLAVARGYQRSTQDDKVGLAAVHVIHPDTRNGRPESITTLCGALLRLTFLRTALMLEALACKHVNNPPVTSNTQICVKERMVCASQAYMPHCMALTSGKGPSAMKTEDLVSSYN